jgi:DNA repair protein RadC
MSAAVDDALIADRTSAEVSENEIIASALQILERRLRNPGAMLRSPDAVRDYLRLSLAGLEREVFVAVWLDTQHRVIAREELFVGTLSQTSVYPREVVKAALRCNCAAVVLVHNHPSGDPEPSMADRELTESLKRALALVDVTVVDHFIVGDRLLMSFAERGWL